MIDIYALKNYIISNPELIEVILENAGFYDIRNHKFNNEYRCAKEKGSNPTSVRVKKDTLSAVCFSTNFKGDLISLIQRKLFLSFSTTIKWIAETIGFVSTEKQEEYQLPFGGFYKKIQRLRENQSIPLEILPETVLDQFALIPNQMFLRDGITADIQHKFKIGFDSVSMRITIPWFAPEGLVGIMGRIYKTELKEEDIKYYPIYPFYKSQVVYGYTENYDSIVEKSVVMIGESEKHTMLLASKGLNFGLSIGGSTMSEQQCNLIKSLFPKLILVMLDEGLEEEHSRDIALRLKSDRFYQNKVGYIYDKNNLFLPKDSKMAPSDLDKNTLKQLIKRCTIWV